MKGGLEWPCKLRWCARLDPLIFSAIIVSLWSVVYAAQTLGISECDQQCPKTRELVTTVWGGAVTLFVLSFDFWRTLKTLVYADNDDSGRKFSEVVGTSSAAILFIINPVFMLLQIVVRVALRYQLRRRMPGFTVLSLLSPWTKDPAKIVIDCRVVITVPKVISIPDRFIDSGLPSLSEAVVIGRGPEESGETKTICLRMEGEDVLLQMGVLPPYDQLKVLQGRSGWASIISSVQSMGYTYGVVLRTVQGLPVSPIEVVALTLSIQVLIKALLHNIVSLSYMPLHVYLTDHQAQTFVDRCSEYTAHEVPISWMWGPYVVIVLLVSGVPIYYVIHVWQTTRIIMVVPIMLTLVGLYLQLIFITATTYGHRHTIGSLIANSCIIMSTMVYVTSYILALVVTIKYWKVDRLNAKSSSMLAQIFPYIGQ